MRRLSYQTIIWLSLATVLLVAGCEHDDTTVNSGAGLQPTLSSIQTNIFTTTCAVSGCHLGSSAPHGLDLSAGQAYGNLVGVASGEVPELQRITANNPDSSYLVIKIEGGARMAPGTGRMPLNRNPLSSEQISVIRQWVSAGAPNN